MSLTRIYLQCLVGSSRAFMHHCLCVRFAMRSEFKTKTRNRRRAADSMEGGGGARGPQSSAVVKAIIRALSFFSRPPLAATGGSIRTKRTGHTELSRDVSMPAGAAAVIHTKLAVICLLLWFLQQSIHARTLTQAGCETLPTR